LKADPTVFLPDFWVKRADKNSNRVTESNLCWEYQWPYNKVRETPAANDSHAVDIVVGRDSYVIVLINDNGVEMGKVVGTLSHPFTHGLALLQLCNRAAKSDKVCE
jgi:hypothetical protein